MRPVPWGFMRRVVLVIPVAALSVVAQPLLAQEGTPAQTQTDPDRPTHGIIRRARPRTTEPVKPPVATTEEAAAAIAAAVRSAEEASKPALPRPRAARPVEPRAPLRRYDVRWPSQRVEVDWHTPDDARVTLSWQDQDGIPADLEGRDRSLEP